MRSSGSPRDAPLDFGWNVAGRPTGSAGSVVVVLVAAGAADHDLLLLDRDLDGPVAGPVLGVHGIVLHGRVEPQPVPLLAVVERGLEGRCASTAAAAAAAPAAAAPRPLGVPLVVGRLTRLGLARLGLR